MSEHKKRSEELIETAKNFASTREHRMPNEIELRFAARTAYFAVHHRVCEMCTTELVGDVSEDDPLYPAWHKVYMSVNDGVLRNACQSVTADEFPDTIVKFCTIFLDLFELRLLCDNEYIYHINLNQALEAISTAEDAMSLIDNSSRQGRLAFSTRIMTQKVERNEMYL